MAWLLVMTAMITMRQGTQEQWMFSVMGSTKIATATIHVIAMETVSKMASIAIRVIH